ncbi:MAG: hypothetical protein LBQ68_07575 [Clostridiales bacterium]|jgi:hypothetical protein|nr:hypothetical protein [Clostridiales bacterium]
MKTIRKITGMFFCLSILSHLSAQVTIGITEAPAEGALLQLRDIVKAATTPGGANAKKGLLMPRVELVDNMTLAPMLHPGASDAEKKEHAGLIVYNLTENDKLKEGIMVWNGEMWNLIKSKEIKKELDSDIKKILYTNVGAIEGNSVSLGSIEATLRKDLAVNTPYYAHPYFRTKQPLNTRNFHYQIGQYWNGGGYSYDVNNVSFTSSNYAYQHLANNSQMAPEERNEVWMFEEGSDDIYHIQFITLGENSISASNIFAVLVERF